MHWPLGPNVKESYHLSTVCRNFLHLSIYQQMSLDTFKKCQCLRELRLDIYMMCPQHIPLESGYPTVSMILKLHIYLCSTGLFFYYFYFNISKLFLNICFCSLEREKAVLGLVSSYTPSFDFFFSPSF